MFFLFISVVFSSVIFSSQEDVFASEDIIDRLLAAEESCVVNFPKSIEEEVDKIKSELVIEDDASEDLKCFLLCMGKKLGLTLEDDSYHAEGLKQLTLDMTDEKTTRDHAHDMVEKCLDYSKEHSMCEKAFHYVKCKLEELKGHNVIKIPKRGGN